jgi:hypothetical protein
MPFMDGTGPRGNGPGAGRGRGRGNRCRFGASAPVAPDARAGLARQAADLEQQLDSVRRQLAQLDTQGPPAR